MADPLVLQLTPPPGLTLQVQPPAPLQLVTQVGQGPSGPPGPAGPPGPPGVSPATGDKHYPHTQGQASDVWTIAHGLGKHPAVTVIDSAGSVVEGGIDYPDLNTVVLTFSAAMGGTAYLN